MTRASTSMPERLPAGLAGPLTTLLEARRTGGEAELLRRTVTRLCELRDEGHLCLDLAACQAADAATFPPVPQWREQLLATGVCADAAGSRGPLVLDGDRLYLLRDHRVERRLVQSIQARLAMPAGTTAARLRATLEALDLLPATPTAEPDWQLAAIAAAAHGSFTLLCGGPGTGKTTTVARLLAVLLHLQPTLRIALAAPTGKAAARMGEALREHAAASPALAATLAGLQARTLHRLLGYQPLDDSFRAGAEQRLPYDVVVVDEASMVDPAILAVLFEALHDDARLLLVGDPDQLAAVAAGHVLGDLRRSAAPLAGVGAPLATFVAAATGMQLPVQADATALANATVALRHNHRFGEQPGIAAFAAAMQRRDPAAALAALAAGHADLQLATDTDAALASFADTFAAMAAATEPVAALQQLRRARILTASRHGPHGSEAWNQRVELLLRARGRRIDGPWYAGRPVLVTSNDHGNQIWNGDLGVAIADASGRLQVWFTADDGAPRAIAPARLPPHETAWAMTVHKAQGSEFDEVLLSMPDRPGPLWQAALVYTGLTRARRRAMLLADHELLRDGLAQWPQRASGLAAALGRG